MGRGSGDRQLNFSPGFRAAPRSETAANDFGSFAHATQTAVIGATRAIENL